MAEEALDLTETVATQLLLLHSVELPVLAVPAHYLD
jgi:hypothetical protein